MIPRVYTSTSIMVYILFQPSSPEKQAANQRASKRSNAILPSKDAKPTADGKTKAGDTKKG